MAILVDRFLSSTRPMEAEEAARAERKRRVAVSNTLVRTVTPAPRDPLRCAWNSEVFLGRTGG